MIDKFFEGITDALGTNWAIFLFALIAFVPLFFQIPKTILEWQMWLSQTCIQLVALAILQRGTQIEGAKSLQLLQETHDKELAEFSELKIIINELKNMHDQMKCKDCDGQPEI